MKTKLPVHRDTEMEKLAGITFEACAAYFDGESVRIVGEAITLNSRPIADYREIQVSVFDEDGDILGRGYTNWGEFQLRQSFEIDIEDLPGEPFRVKAYPSKG